MLLWSPSRILKRCRLKKINPIFNKSKSHSMTHSSNICNHPPPVPLRNDLGLAVKIFWGRGQKKRVISRNSVNCHQKPFTKSFPVLRIQLEAFTGEKTDTQSHGPAGQTEETASYHKSVSHVPNGYREGWVFLPPQLSLGRQTQKQSLEINYLYHRLFFSGPVPQIQLLTEPTPEQWKTKLGIRRGSGDLPVVLLCCWSAGWA